MILHLKKMFHCITTSGIVYLNYHLPNVFYVNTFCRYSPQYAVEIGQKIKERFNWHKTFQKLQKILFALLRNSTRISLCHVHKLNTSFSPDAFLNKFKFYLRSKHFDSPNFARIHLSSTNKKIKKLLLMKALRMPITPYTLFYLMLLDIFDSKILKPPPLVKKKHYLKLFSITSCTNL